MTTTFRQDVVSTVKTTLDTYAAANPTLLKHVYSEWPASFGDLPCAFVGPREEQVAGDRSTRTRVITLPAVIVDKVTTNKESVARLDVLVDALLDAFTAAMRDVPLHGPLSIGGTQPFPIPDGQGIYIAEAILLSAETQEGTGL